MMIQDKIDEVVFQVQDVLKDAAIPEGDKKIILDGVKNLGFQWLTANAHGRAMSILLGLMKRKYPEHLVPQFIRECVELEQYDELKQREDEGAAYVTGRIGMPLYSALIDLLMVQSINGADAADPEDEDPDEETGEAADEK